MKRLGLALVGLVLFCTVSLWAFSDDFLRADAATLGANWSAAEGADWSIVSNKAVISSLFFFNAIVPTGTFPAAQFAQVDTSCVTTGSPLAGVVLRATGNTYYKMYCQNGGAGTGTLGLYRRVAGGDAFLATFQTGLTLDFVYTFKASISSGHVISCFVGGVPCTSVATFDDSAGPPIASGSPGMFGVSSSAGTPTFDNFSSTDPTAGTARPPFIGGGVF